MKKIILIVAVAASVASLAGCSTEKSRIRDCMDEGYSRNACYTAEKANQSAMNAAAEKQAMENAQNQWKNQDSGRKHHRHHDDDDY